MLRRGHFGGVKNGSAAGDDVSRLIPNVSSSRHREDSNSGVSTRDVNATALGHCVQNTPMQAAPFTPARKFHNPSAPTSTRKVSASFSTDYPQSGHATVAYSAVTASITTNHPGPLTSHPVYLSSALPPSRSHCNMGGFAANRALKTSHTYSNLPMPAANYKSPSPKRAVANAHTSAKAIPGHNEENIPPSVSMASITANTKKIFNHPTPRLVPKSPSPKKKVKSRPGIPRSRTFSVFSNLTASLSRASLGQLTGSGDSRHTSTSSKGTVRRDTAPYMNPQSASSASSQTLLNSGVGVETANPGKIYTAQSSAYWTGRFVALQDRFQSEMLMPENLTTLVHAHAERSLLPVTQPSLASSATMSYITPATKPMYSATKSTSPRKAQKPPPKFQYKPRSVTTVAPPRPSCEAASAAALLVDEDARARRIFSHLDALCATAEARNSLQKWQQSYARRMGKENLLPEGGTMQGRTRELTWVGRLLIGNGGGHSKRSGL